MVIKWKKRNISIVLLYVLSVSLILTGLMGLARQGLFRNGISSCAERMGKRDFQDTEDFRNFISSRFYDFLCMACGDDLSENAYYDYYAYDSGITYDMVEEAEASQEEALSDETQVYNVSESALTVAEKKENAKRFHVHIRTDKNLLYRIAYNGTEMFSNMNEMNWQYDAKNKDLPEGYNFLLHFDGTKATMQKDGMETDLYGDGIYRGGQDWRLPGYKNYTGKEKWKKAEILILAAKEPVLYPQTDGYWLESELYYLNERFLEQRNGFRLSTGYLLSGVILLIAYLILKKEKRRAGKWFAEQTKKIWFEWKFLLFFLMPVLFGIFSLTQSAIYGVWGDYAAELGYEEVSLGTYVSEAASFFQDALWEHRVFLLGAFWLLHFFFSDLCHNRGSYKNSGLGKLAAVMEKKSFSLPLSKRLVRRFYGIVCLTAIQMIFFVILFAAVLVWSFQSDWMVSYGVSSWCLGMLLLAMAMTAGLFVLEYRYQKRNHQFAADLETFSGRITAIRDGNYTLGDNSAGVCHTGMPEGYENEETVTVEDEDIRHMAAELEDIRKGLETAVEERIGSERMKVELVANVSHDIKTPLTSIISYIQLLKQEEGLPDHIRDYVCILDEKSERLKNMVQDVFAVSKAASGQLQVEKKELDLGKLLYQTLADMEETIQAAPVTIKTEIPKEPVFIRSDGGRIYRVFQNLIGNAVKYSLEGSRVYVSLKAEGDLAVASVKNTSSRELNMETDFTERFVRGDESRTDGGSGLGLSIAKSFTEACGGTFQLETIADLFVVTVSFRK